LVVAARLAAQPPDRPLDQKSFLTECVAVGQQYVLQKRLQNPECVSRELFGNALLLAGNRGLLDPKADGIAAGRARFAAEMSAMVTAVAAIDEYDQQIRAGIRKPH
jgi:glycerol-3-phosphate O-acyltransferase